MFVQIINSVIMAIAIEILAFLASENHWLYIPINKPTHHGIIIPTLQIIHPDLGIIVIPTITEGVSIGHVAHVVGNINAGVVGDRGYLAPRVVGISCNNRADLVGDFNDITLQVLVEIVRCIVIDDTAYAVLVVVEGNQSAIAPGFLQNLGAVELVGVQYAVNRLACADAVGVVLFLLYNKLQALSILGQKEPRRSPIRDRDGGEYKHCVFIYSSPNDVM